MSENLVFEKDIFKGSYNFGTCQKLFEMFGNSSFLGTCWNILGNAGMYLILLEIVSFLWKRQIFFENAKS